MNALLRRSQVVVPCVIWIVLVQFSSAQEKSTRARQILSDPSQPAAEARQALLALGDDAIEPVVDALAKEEQATLPRQAFLVGILGSLHSPSSNRALGHLLDDRRPLVRANAASALGRNHEVCAVPRLVRLLNDRAEYGQEVSTDPHHEKALAVGTAASKALETITGVHCKAAANGRRAKAFEHWWDQAKSRQDCTSWK